MYKLTPLLSGLFALMATTVSAATFSASIDGQAPTSLGTIQGAGTAADFYDYRSGTANVPFDLDLATAYAFIYENTTSGDVSLGMVFTGGNIAQADLATCQTFAGDPNNPCRTRYEFSISGLSATSIVSVKDDSANAFGDEDASDVGANGAYDLAPFRGTTDGFVVDNLDSDFDFSLVNIESTRIENLTFVSGSNGSFTYSPFGSAFQSVSLTANAPNLAPVPVPASIGLLAGGFALLAGLGAANRRRTT